MNILYKYYSSSFNLFEHLKRPLIKLAHTGTFNDPFESFIPGLLAENMSVKFLERFVKDEYMSKAIEDYKSDYQKSPTGYGVVSLSETHRNTLMWAHYANSSRGYCIGYKSDFISDDVNKSNMDIHRKHYDFTPHRVRYDSKRFDYEKYISTANDNNPPINHILDSMTIKSNEWIYEKEHRCIIPFRYGEVVKFTQPISKPLEKIVSRLLRKGFVTKGRNELEYIRSNNLLLGHHYNVNLDFARIAKSKEAMVMKSISEDKIDSIYFGCQSDSARQKRVCNYINKNEDRLGHIKVYRYKTNSETFEIDEHRIR